MKYRNVREEWKSLDQPYLLRDDDINMMHTFFILGKEEGDSEEEEKKDAKEVKPLTDHQKKM
jgi:hypothetical protein